MDRRKLQRMILCIAILLLTLVLGSLLLNGAWRIVYREDARKLGALAAEYPEEEAALAAVFNGASAGSGTDPDAGSNADSDASPSEDPAPSQIGNDTLAEGLRLFDKYGYTLSDSIRSGTLWRYALAGAALFTAAVVLVILVLLKSAAESKKYRKKIVRLEEDLEETRRHFELTERKLRREEQNTKSLVTDISHQLKTPLASLKMSYELADSPELTAEEHAEFTRKEREEVSRMESLLGVFSQLTRLESGMIQIRPENSSLKKTISEAVGGIYMKAFEKGIDILLEEFPDVMIPHDPRWTAEVILNILDNAVKYSPSGTAVSIRVSALASYMMVEISDQGIGIPASDIQNIFKRFYRGSAPEIKSADGSGVGLYLARRILEEQGGTICVKTGTDGGSTFALTLPK